MAEEDMPVCGFDFFDFFFRFFFGSTTSWWYEGVELWYKEQMSKEEHMLVQNMLTKCANCG
jgi:hypothetical protein